MTGTSRERIAKRGRSEIPNEEATRNGVKRKCEPQDYRTLLRGDHQKALKKDEAMQRDESSASIVLGSSASSAESLMLRSILGRRSTALEPRINHSL